MKSTFKTFIYGIILGAVAAFPLGINFGRDAPLLSNPFAKRDIKAKVKVKAEKLLEDAKETIHEATEPVRKKLER